jgi:hypothetical protein
VLQPLDGLVGAEQHSWFGGRKGCKSFLRARDDQVRSLSRAHSGYENDRAVDPYNFLPQRRVEFMFLGDK